jgi:hypothetical protein
MATLQLAAVILQRFEQGIECFRNSAATLWKRNATHEADGTVMGASSDYEKGWTVLEPGGDLAYTIAVIATRSRCTW